jgi:hypothetical protein
MRQQRPEAPILLGGHGERMEPSSRADFAREALQIPEVTIPMLAPHSFCDARKSLPLQEQFIIRRQQPMHGRVTLTNRKPFLAELQNEWQVCSQARGFKRQSANEPVVNLRAVLRMESRNWAETEHDLKI